MAQNASVVGPTQGPETKALHAIVMDAKTGKTLYAKAADVAFPPASMSKLMTMLMVFEAIGAGEISIDEPVPISVNAWKRGGANSGGSTMYAEVKSRVRLDDLMHGVIIQSANDAAIAIAERLAGSEKLFAEQMTKRAHELGLKDAQFRNATGLPEEGHQMTARELALLSEYIIRTYPQFYSYYSQPSFTWNKITQANRNPLLKDYPGADGMKTGYTQQSGYGLVGSAQRDGRRLVLVISGCASIGDRTAEAKKLLDWGFAQYRTFEAYKAGETVGRARVWGGVESHVDLRLQQPLTLSLTADEQKLVAASIVYKGPLLAPVEQGAVVGKLRVMMEGNLLGEVPLLAARRVDETPEMWRKAVDSLLIFSFGG